MRFYVSFSGYKCDIFFATAKLFITKCNIFYYNKNKLLIFNKLNLYIWKKIGQIIKEVVEKRNYKVTTLAKELGTTRNNIYDIYERDSIDTYLLNRIGHILEYDFFEHFLKPQTIEKIKLSESIKKSKILVEIELNEDEIMKVGFEEKVLKILSKK